MSIYAVGRFGLGLALVVLLAGCSSGGSRSGDCSWYRSSCMYERSYEAGEEGYAEQEAKRLNKAATSRLRRSSGN